jgi:hypothetical protein
MGFAGIASHDGKPAVCFYLPHRSVDTESSTDPTADEERTTLVRSFEREVSAPLQSSASLGLKFISAHSDRVRRLEPRLRRYCHRLGLEYLGLFHDDLVKELATVLDRDEVQRWLHTPHPVFAGRTPAEFLDDPLDYRLRDMISRAKFDLPAA